MHVHSQHGHGHDLPPCRLYTCRQGVQDENSCDATVMQIGMQMGRWGAASDKSVSEYGSYMYQSLSVARMKNVEYRLLYRSSQWSLLSADVLLCIVRPPSALIEHRRWEALWERVAAGSGSLGAASSEI